MSSTYQCSLLRLGHFSTLPPQNYDKIHQNMMHNKAIISIEVESETCSINRNQYQGFQFESKDKPNHFPNKGIACSLVQPAALLFLTFCREERSESITFRESTQWSSLCTTWREKWRFRKCILVRSIGKSSRCVIRGIVIQYHTKCTPILCKLDLQMVSTGYV